MELSEVLDELMGELEKLSQGGALVGKGFALGKTHMVPLCKLTLGFGTGTTDSQGRGAARGGALEGAGAGGALSVEPRAFVVVGPDGVPQLLSMKGGKRAVLQRAVRIVPRSGEGE